ncbi:MAG: metallophosphoesterase [Eubacteriales bacterium]|nr:metallophosphoesterase [Eubacteriales bacterium]
MRFIHVSDVRLGLNPDSEKKWGRQRAKELKTTFKRVVDKVSEEGCDLLLISGSLFSHQPVSAELAEVNRMLAALPGTEVVIIAGRSDMLRRNAPVRSFCFAPNVHYVSEPGLTELKFPALNTTVYAASRTETGAESVTKLSEEYRNRFAGKENAAIRILLAPECGSGCGAALSDGSLKELLSAFSYTAIGGTERRELIPERAVCAGTVEPVSMGEPGEHGIYLGDLSPASGRMIGFSFLPIAAASYIPLLINVTEDTDTASLMKLLAGEMDKRGRNNVYRLRLSGKRRPETEFSAQLLEDTYRIEEFVDETEPQYDFSALFAEHPQDMIGFYISRLMKQDEEMSEIGKKAMYYGIHALLKTAGGK